MKRVLVLTPRYPYPVIGGDRLRIYEICRELAKTCKLTLLSLCETPEEMNAPLPKDGIFDSIERVYLPKWRSVLSVISALPSQTPLQIAYYRSGKFARRVDVLIQEHDVCVAHLIRTAEYVRHCPIPTVLEMTDAISLNYKRVRELGSVKSIKSLAYVIEARRLREYERRVVHDFDVVTLVSNKDASFLLDGQPSKRILVCSNGVHLEGMPFRVRVDSSPVAVFIGNMTSMQNLDACVYFIEEILPELRRRREISFRIVGRIGPADAARFTRYRGVEVLGNVLSIPDSVGNARVGVAPIRLGAGVQNKILEYMALGLPTVTSSIGLEGLEAKPGVEILVADSVEEYDAHLGRIWADQSYATSLAFAGRRYVERHHSWSSQLEPLVQRVNSLEPPVGRRAR